MTKPILRQDERIVSVGKPLATDPFESFVVTGQIVTGDALQKRRCGDIDEFTNLSHHGVVYPIFQNTFQKWKSSLVGFEN